jgi:hypothetical protein
VWRFLPQSLRRPPEQIDAYLAAVLGRRWLDQSGRKKSSP